VSALQSIVTDNDNDDITDNKIENKFLHISDYFLTFDYTGSAETACQYGKTERT
jgi:hypothetical protein